MQRILPISKVDSWKVKHNGKSQSFRTVSSRLGTRYNSEPHLQQHLTLHNYETGEALSSRLSYTLAANRIITVHFWHTQMVQKSYLKSIVTHCSAENANVTQCRHLIYRKQIILIKIIVTLNPWQDTKPNCTSLHLDLI